MILRENGERFESDGKIFTVGGTVIANDKSDYDGFVGTVREIRSNSDKETDNDTPDIYCDFYMPVAEDDIKEAEKRFSKLYGYNCTVDKIDREGIIMSPEMLDAEPVNKRYIKMYCVKEEWANDDSFGTSYDLFFSFDAAKADFRKKLAIAGKIDDIICSIKSKPDFVCEQAETTFECYTEDFYDESHYCISVDRVDVLVTDADIQSLKN